MYDQFDTSDEVRSKYLDKGIIMEDQAIEMLSEMRGGSPLSKNEKHFFNAFISGTPDIITDRNVVIDIKCSWDASTFPFFKDELPEKNYYWQLQSYMKLTGAKESYIAYVLVDTPEVLIEREKANMAWKIGDELPEELESELDASLRYDHLPQKNRIKLFRVDYSDEDVKLLKERVELCRAYLSEKKKMIS